MALFKKNFSKNPASDDQMTDKLAQVRRQEEEQRTKDLAAKLGLPYLNLSALPIQGDALGLIDETEAKAGQLAIIQKSGFEIKAALADPKNSVTLGILDRLKQQKLNVAVFLVSRSSLQKAWQTYQNVIRTGAKITEEVSLRSTDLKQISQEVKTLADVKNKLGSLKEESATGFLEIIIAGALANSASDIHIEKEEKQALLRYRLDGMLQDAAPLPPKVYSLLLSRIKLLANITLNVRDQAQDGRFSIALNEKDIEVRVSVIPGAYGENIVMRILNPTDIELGLERLGFRPDALKFMQEEIRRPNGIIVTTGPTGSGKTTTLYAFLKSVTRPEIKIITLEDPIEYHLSGITQTQVEAERGYTFASGLRAILRQDPDVILVGEIRDKETAEVALQAALTGHIVFSTLHTNDAAGAIPRFIDLGANPTTLSAGLIDIMAQRLLRRVCQKCQESYSPSAEETAKIKKALADWPKKIPAPEFNEKTKLVRGRGCPACNNTGYKGRIAVYEIIPVTPEIEKLITKSPSHAEVLETIKKGQGFISLYQDGLLKVLSGVTTLAELENVVGQS